ncbi:MAG: 23S rRNA (adenine(2503)-C(2))-methyltransferase RlmN [Pseudomonadota bacterium]
MQTPKDIKDFTEQALIEEFKKRGIEPYRASQILRWIYHDRATSFEQMTNLPLSLRREFADEFVVSRLRIDKMERGNDGTCKYLFGLEDGIAVESVLIPEKGHWTLCVSSQAGCSQGCIFCLTGKGGLKRNLTCAEIVGQVWEVLGAHDFDLPLRNIVFMGMGEPLANYSNLIDALKIIMADYGLNFSRRKVTVSTAGLVPRIAQLGKDITVNLAISLNAVDNLTRDYLMPINKKYPIESLIDACKEFTLPRRRMITFEYVLLAGINDSPSDAFRLAKLLRPLRAKINLIPFNPFPASEFKRPHEDDVLTFQRILIDKYYTAMIRYSKGGDISAACGQLSQKIV